VPFELQVIRASECVCLDADEHLDFEASKKAIQSLRTRVANAALTVPCWICGTSRCQPNHSLHRRSLRRWSGLFARPVSASANGWPCFTGAILTPAPGRLLSSADSEAGRCGLSTNLKKPCTGCRKKPAARLRAWKTKWRLLSPEPGARRSDCKSARTRLDARGDFIEPPGERPRVL
jgi:hypothetical protein